MIGKTLNHYEVLESLGAGGMGEVYRAHDTKLARDVAIKLLPAHLADDSERLARLQREAQLLAALNHPNIAAIYGLEEATFVPGAGVETGTGPADREMPEAGPSTAIHFLAMELAEGRTLAQRLSDGALGVDESLKIALQVAEALEAAHEAGIVHRDLKPANIQVATEGSAAGQVKVLDFGLAKALEAEGDRQEISPDLSASPTMAAATRTGMIMGTAAYMSPEQARGKPVDKRTDIWAFGCVLFETLTGKRAFQGETVTDILAAIVHQEPQWEALPPDTPLRIRELLRRSLKKQADERLRDVGECRIAVKEYLADPEGEKKRALATAASGAAAGTAARASWKLALPAAAAALIVGALATWWAMQPTAQPVMRFEIELPPEVDFTRTGRHVLAISPDGTHIAFVANEQLWLRRIGELEATPIPGTHDPLSPFFSPDGLQIGFFADGQFKRVAVTGGAAVSLGPASSPHGASWADNGMIYFGQGRQGIWQVPGTGGTPEVVIEMGGAEFADGPQLLPGGEWLLFTLASTPRGWNDASIVAQSLVSGERKLLIAGGTQGRYVSTGHLVYGHDGTLFAVPFDLGNIEATPGPVSVVEGVRAAGFTGAVNYEFSDQGNLVFVPGTGANFGGETSSLAWVDRQGAVETLPFAPQAFNNPRLSPDGTRIAVEINDGEVTQIWILEVERGGSQPLTVEGSNTNPVWSHDGEWVYFASDRGAGVDIWRKRADRSAAAEPVLEAEEVQIPYSVSADGELLLFFSFGSQNPDIWILSLAGDAEPEQLIATAAATYAPYVSPDGRLVAFTTDESGNREVSVAEIATGRLWPISIGTGRNPVWSRDGSEIFYYGGGGRWYSVDVTHDPDFSAASPQELFRMTPGTDDFLDISADAQKFLIRQAGDVAETPTEPSTPRISVVLNWFEELAQRVPTGR